MPSNQISASLHMLLIPYLVFLYCLFPKHTFTALAGTIKHNYSCLKINFCQTDAST